MSPPMLILVGGFLGAGKTTLLAQAAALLARRGSRVGLLTNDQAPNLVDTALLKHQGFEVGEVAGGCFCCRFDQFVAAADRLVADGWPEVILAEPVGSCTDLTATVIAPLQQMHADRFQVAPFSVLVDPLRWEATRDRGTDPAFQPDVRYIFAKQLEEADVVVLNKQDLLTPEKLESLRMELAARHPHAAVMSLSALRGEGVEEWLEAVLRGASAGKHVTQVDYDTYAGGEAALGWLNATVRLRAPAGSDWPEFCRRFARGLQGELRERKAEVAHVKLFLSAPGLVVSVNLTRADEEPSCHERGACGKDDAHAWLTVNARVQLPPEALREAFERGLGSAAGEAVEARIEKLDCFSPARPQPTHRLSAGKP
jgi:Ni2+-binding GTPase involved in maturation of urease and hydrogenase